INERRLFRYPLKYLMLINKADYSTFLAIFEQFDVLPMSNIVIACFEESSTVNMYQPYKTGENGILIIENYGTWSKKNGIRILHEVPLLERRRNLQNYTLHVGTVVNNLASLEVKNINDITEFGEDEPYFFQDIPNMYNLLEYLNASFMFRVFDSYGYLNHTTGKFNGMARDLYDEKSHISGVSLILSEDRIKIVEYLYSYEYWSTKSKFILKKPSMSYVDNIYYTTFDNQVWIATLVILLIFATVLYVLLNWENNNLNDRKDRKCTVSDITLLSLEAVCQQGTYTDSKTYSGKTIILILFTAFMFIYIAYSSYILVLLQSTKPISSIRELGDSRIECGGFNVSFMMTYYTDAMFIAVPKTSQYKKLFKTGLLIAKERGLQNRIKNRMSIKPKCYNEGGNFQSVRIYDCHSVFIMFALGVLLSLAVLSAEILSVKYRQEKKKH
ncbi:hypothetical protein NQ318_010194, partial [Aromia moschata]